MSIEAMALLLGGFLVAIGATIIELRAAFEPAACPECPHCRMRADATRLREERELARLEERIRDVEPPEERARRHGRGPRDH